MRHDSLTSALLVVCTATIGISGDEGEETISAANGSLTSEFAKLVSVIKQLAKKGG